MEDWFLERQGHPGTRYHLNILLGTKDKVSFDAHNRISNETELYGT